MENPKLKKIKEKMEQLAAQAKLIEARERTKARKEETRRKILFGAYLMEQMEKDAALKTKTMKGMEGFLTRPIDRKLLGFDASQSSHKRDYVSQQTREREPEKPRAQNPQITKPQGEKADDSDKKQPQKKIA